MSFTAPPVTTGLCIKQLSNDGSRGSDGKKLKIKTKPMSYDSLKKILGYMEANKRFELSSRCPSVRTADQVTPLRIEQFNYYDENKLIVNDTVYELSIIRHLRNAKNPESITKANEKGGVSYDVDIFGRRIWNYSERRLPTPGDIGPFKSDRNTHPDVIQRFREDYEADVATVRCNTYLKLTVSLGTKEIVNYKRSIGMAMKSLTSKFLGNRKSPIQVNHLAMEANLIRLPVGLQFRIRKLSTHQNFNKLMDGLKNILDERSFPLDYVQTPSGDKGYEGVGHPVVRSAKILAIRDLDKNTNWSDFLPNLHNPEIRLLNDEIEEAVIPVITNWKYFGRDIGTQFTSLSIRKRFMQEIIERVTRQFPSGVEVSERCIMIPRNKDSAIQVSFEEDGNEYFMPKIEMVKNESESSK